MSLHVLQEQESVQLHWLETSPLLSEDVPMQQKTPSQGAHQLLGCSNDSLPFFLFTVSHKFLFPVNRSQKVEPVYRTVQNQNRFIPENRFYCTPLCMNCRSNSCFWCKCNGVPRIESSLEQKNSQPDTLVVSYSRTLVIRTPVPLNVYLSNLLHFIQILAQFTFTRLTALA